MISVGNQKERKKRQWNHFNHMPMQSLMGDYHRLPLLYMAKSYIWIEETKERIIEFSI